MEKWSSRQTHNLEIPGPNPGAATKLKQPMEADTKTPKEEQIYKDAIKLLENINELLKDYPGLEHINIKMVGVVKDLNNMRIEKITGKTVTAE